MVTWPWKEPLLSCFIGRLGFHSPAQTKSALRTVRDSHPSHGSHSTPTCGGSRGAKSKRLILCPILGKAPPRQAATLLVIGLTLSRYRSVRISQVPSVGSLKWSFLILPNVQSCSALRKEHPEWIRNGQQRESYSTELKLATCRFHTGGW